MERLQAWIGRRWEGIQDVVLGQLVVLILIGLLGLAVTAGFIIWGILQSLSPTVVAFIGFVGVVCAIVMVNQADDWLDRRRAATTPGQTAVPPETPIRHHVMWCGIRWEWRGRRYRNGEPIVFAHCLTHPEVELAEKSNNGAEISSPDRQNHITQGRYNYSLYCIEGPHLLHFDDDCESSHFGQVQDRAIRLMAATLRRENLE